MSKATSILLALILSILISSIRSQLSVSPILPVCLGIPTSSKIQLYVQDEQSSVNETDYIVAQSYITPTSPTSFGLVIVSDDKLTAGPDYYSEEVGRAQGTVTYADLKVFGLSMNINFYFTIGKYNGSTISISGRNPVNVKPNRELPIVGGTGVFRCARGYAIVNTYSTDLTSNNSVFAFTFYVDYFS